MSMFKDFSHSIRHMSKNAYFGAKTMLVTIPV